MDPSGWLENVPNDCRYAARRLRRSPGFAAAAIVTLALGIGANVAAVTVVPAVLLNPLPYPHPEQLVRLFDDRRGSNSRDVGMSAPELWNRRDRSNVFEDLSAIWPTDANLTGGDHPERIELRAAGTNYFTMLAARPQIGRLYTQDDEQPGFIDGVVLSDRFWRRTFGGDPGALGIFTVVLGLVFLPPPAHSTYFDSRGDGDAADSVDIVAQELAAMGRRGEIVADARERTLALLRNNDACAEWFQESNPDTAEVFRSLHYAIEDAQPSYTLRKRDARNLPLLKHPWAAHAIQYGGPKSTIGLNVNGPFFRTMSPVHDVGPLWLIGHPLDHTQLGVASFRGDTAAAQITILLHELGHVVGRLPLDSDSWDGQSSRNTVEVLRHCKPDIHEVAQKNWQRGN